MQHYTLAELKILRRLGYSQEQLDLGNIEIAEAQLIILDRIEALEEKLKDK